MTSRDKLIAQNMSDVLKLLLDKVSQKPDRTYFEMWQSCSVSDVGEMVIAARKALRYASNQFLGYDGKLYTIGDRVELSPGCDLWMQGAKFGKVMCGSTQELHKVCVKMEHKQVRELQLCTEDMLRKV